MNVISIKRNLRQLKRMEQKIRTDTGHRRVLPPVWDSFFDVKGTGRAKYTLDILAAMNKADYQAVIGEYWSYVYHAFFSENEAKVIHFDTDILLGWNLPADADEAAVKSRFRVLAKRYHPDTGGDAQRFIRLMAEYRKLTGK